MDYDNITRLTSTALLLCLLVSLPAVGVAAIAGLLICSCRPSRRCRTAASRTA